MSQACEGGGSHKPFNPPLNDFKPAACLCLLKAKLLDIPVIYSFVKAPSMPNAAGGTACASFFCRSRNKARTGNTAGLFPAG